MKLRLLAQALLVVAVTCARPQANAGDAKTHFDRGIALHERGDVNGATAEFSEAIRLKPDNAKAHNNLGSALHGKGDHDGAIAEFREAIRLKPNYADAHYNLAGALNDKG